jgi:pseudaminic acid synthase
MVKAIRDTEKLLGRVSYEMTPKKLKSREFSRSIFISNDIKKGEIFTEKNVQIVRPSNGLPPKYISQVLGKIAQRDYKKGEPLTNLPTEELK